MHAQCNPFRNANSNVTGTIDPLNGTTAYAFDAADRQIAVRAPLGLITTTVYDPDSLVSATIDALNARTTFGYDGASRRVSVTDPLGAITTTVYDAANRHTRKPHSDGTLFTYTYGFVGN